MNTINLGDPTRPNARPDTAPPHPSAARSRPVALSPTEDPVTAAILEVLDRMSKQTARTATRPPPAGNPPSR